MRVPINVNNVIGRHKEPFLSSGYRFPTTKEVEQAVAEITDSFNQRNTLVDRYFPEDSTFASELEMYLLRTQQGEQAGMTLVHQVGSNVLPVDVRASKVDLARASWSPLAFKESRTWDEKEMLYLGRLTEEVQASEINAQVADFLVWMMERMRNRRDWMVWQLMTTGKIVIDANTVGNPSGLRYDIDFGMTDMEIVLATKFDVKTGSGSEAVSSVDPIQYFIDLKKAATFYPEKMPVKIITNSHFIEVLTDNTFIQYLVDYERGWTAVEMRPPRAVYRQAALEVFQRYTGIQVELFDATYRDGTGAVKYWIPTGRMIILNQSDSALGKFMYTAHVAGSSNGKVLLGTGPYIHVHDQTTGDPPFYKIMGGFHGLPQLSGYDPMEFEYHRIKWMDYATESTVETAYQIPFPDKKEI
jgi:hypothetical protein